MAASMDPVVSRVIPEPPAMVVEPPVTVSAPAPSVVNQSSAERTRIVVLNLLEPPGYRRHPPQGGTQTQSRRVIVDQDQIGIVDRSRRSCQDDGIRAVRHRQQR